jgi:hypothetical protein
MTTTKLQKKLQRMLKRDAKAFGLRMPLADRGGLSCESQLDVNYRAEAGLAGSRPLPRKLADMDAENGEPSRAVGTSAALVRALAVPVGGHVGPYGGLWDDLDVPAFRVLGLKAIADPLGISKTTLREHMRDPTFPKGCVRKVGWLYVSDIDHMLVIDEWIRGRRVGKNKNHIRKRAPSGRAIRSHT